MQLDEIINAARDQERGAVLNLLDPVAGMPIGVRISIVGPDSDTARAARLKLADELAEVADADGRVTAAQRETARLNMLAALIKDWDVLEAGQRVPFSTTNVLRLIRIEWVQAQVDAFAADRRNFAPAVVGGHVDGQGGGGGAV